MELLGKYLKQRWRGLAVGVLFLVIFMVTFALYRLPVKAVLYPALLCLLIGSLFVILDLIRVNKKHRMMRQIREFADVVTEMLPAVEGIEEEDYQNVLCLLTGEHGDFVQTSHMNYNEMVDYYTVWAHQIKTPIAAMKLTLQNEDTQFSRKLSNDLFRIEQYVEMVLTFLRLDSESTDYVIKEYDLDGIVRQAVKKFSGEFISRKISLVYEPLQATVITDEKWLSFVVEQILSNALKYTPSGSITIRLEPDKKLYISDTGIGIAPEDLPRIFENGYTGYNGRTDKKASGIGLYLCKRICDKLGHGIAAESKLDEGTTIILDLSQRKRELE